MGTVPAAFGGPYNPNLYEVNPLILSFLNLTHIRPFYSERRPTLTCILLVNFAVLHSRLSTWTTITFFPHDRKAPRCQNFLFVKTFLFQPPNLGRATKALVSPTRSSGDHPPGPVRLPDYKCRFFGPLRLKFSPRWLEVEYIIAARGNNRKSLLHAPPSMRLKTYNTPECPSFAITNQPGPVPK